MNRERLDRIRQRVSELAPSSPRRELAKDCDDLISCVEELRSVLREIIDDASPCTMACNLVVEERLIDRAKELLGE